MLLIDIFYFLDLYHKANLDIKKKYILCGKYDRAYYKYFKKNEKNEIIEPNKLFW